MKQRSCLECGAGLVPITLLYSVSGSAYGDGLEYATPDAKRSLWTGRVPAAGSVYSWMCSECGRIALYAERAVDHLPLPAASPEPASLPLPTDASAGTEADG